MPDRVCKHERKRLIAKDDNSEYVECLDCGEILEAGELPATASTSPNPSGFDESLSDA